MNKTNNQEYVAKLKKTYSTFAQATNRIIAEEGTPRADKGGWITSVDSIYELYKPYLHITKDCGSAQGCFPIAHMTMHNQRWNFNTSTGFRKFVLSDGTQVLLNYDTNCSDCSCTKYSTNGSCGGEIVFDVNGARKPNVLGKDVFGFVIKENGLYPYGCDGTEDCTVGTGSGLGCTCKVLREDAINY